MLDNASRKIDQPHHRSVIYQPLSHSAHQSSRMWTRDCVRRFIAGEHLGLPSAFNDSDVLPRKNPLLG
eukprot:scaffold297988_cov15-Prasinocladus_malaysianus.AAC.1